MKTTIRFSILLMFLFTASLVHAQEAKKSENVPSSSGTKAQDHNSTRSNKTSSIAAPDPNGQNNQDIKPDAGQSANSKKGYDYYKAKSDLNTVKPTTKAQDHNSTRSNKTASTAEPNDKTDTENKVSNQNSSRSNNPQPVK